MKPRRQHRAGYLVDTVLCSLFCIRDRRQPVDVLTSPVSRICACLSIFAHLLSKSDWLDRLHSFHEKQTFDARRHRRENLSRLYFLLRLQATQLCFNGCFYIFVFFPTDAFRLICRCFNAIDGLAVLNERKASQLVMSKMPKFSHVNVQKNCH